jgi:hypothetical protein
MLDDERHILSLMDWLVPAIRGHLSSMSPFIRSEPNTHTTTPKGS